MNLRARIGIGVLPLFLALGAAGQTLNLRGRVLEKARMQPVAGATVKINGGTLSAVTGADGRFVLQGSGTGISTIGTFPRFALRDGFLVEESGGTLPALRMEILDLGGRSIAAAGYARAGERFALPPVPADFLGILRVTTEGGSMQVRILSLGGNLQSGMPLRPASSRHRGAPVAHKGSAAPEITITMAKLLPRTLAAFADDADLGDIVLDYPARELGLGASAPYGADQLIPSEGDSASARAHIDSLWIHKMNSWRQGQGLGTTPVLWKVLPDPAAPAGGYKPSLAPCCQVRNGSPGWGYDDIITKKAYGDIQVHLEFNMMGLPDGNASAAGYCNSGVYLKGSLELQIETPKENPSAYEKLHGICTLIDIKLPDKNMYPGPGIWQSYDITLRASRADTAAKVTVYWNGEKVHDNVNWKGASNSAKVGFALQNELGSDVRYRNVWLKELEIADTRTDFGY